MANPLYGKEKEVKEFITALSKYCFAVMNGEDTSTITDEIIRTRQILVNLGLLDSQIKTIQDVALKATSIEWSREVFRKISLKSKS